MRNDVCTEAAGQQRENQKLPTAPITGVMCGRDASTILQQARKNPFSNTDIDTIMSLSSPHKNDAFRSSLTLPQSSPVLSTSATWTGQQQSVVPLQGSERTNLQGVAREIAHLSRQQPSLKALGESLSNGEVLQASARAGRRTLTQVLAMSEGKNPTSNTSTIKKQKILDVNRQAALENKSQGTEVGPLDLDSPQGYLDNLLRERGYSTERHPALHSGYYCKPTSHQKASYGIETVRAVRRGDASRLAQLLRCGLSRNPCNEFGESLVHMVCRRANYDLLRVFADAGCSVQVTDDFGRTPLHDACWTAEPCFRSVDLILRRDRRLLHVLDCRGSTPLAYVRKEHWQKWVAFFDENKDAFWPRRNVEVDGEEPPPSLMAVEANTNSIADPENSASNYLASLVASGGIDCQKVMEIPPEQRKDVTNSSLNFMFDSTKRSNEVKMRCSSQAHASPIAVIT